ncbi:MAG: hypothetical protein ABR886_03010 [Dehalococcoidales bacterium]
MQPRSILVVMLVCLVAALLIIASGCLIHRDFSKDVKWSFVDGDGSWNGKSRKWNVYLGPGETKSLHLRLDNTISQNVTVLVVVGGPPDYIHFHLIGPFIPLDSNQVEVPAGGSTEFTITASAVEGFAPQGSHNYVVDLSWSTNEKAPSGRVS